jgi:hypothetical protein
MKILLARQFGEGVARAVRVKDVDLPVVPMVGWDVRLDDMVVREVTGVTVTPSHVRVDLNIEPLENPRIRRAEEEGWRHA